MPIKSIHKFSDSFLSPDTLYRYCQLITSEHPDEYLKNHPLIQESTDNWNISVINEKDGTHGLIIKESAFHPLTTLGNAVLCGKGIIQATSRYEMKLISKKVDEITQKINETIESYQSIRFHFGSSDRGHYLFFSKDPINLSDFGHVDDYSVSLHEDVFTPELASLFIPGGTVLRLAKKLNLISKSSFQYLDITRKLDDNVSISQYIGNVAEAAHAHKSHNKGHGYEYALSEKSINARIHQREVTRPFEHSSCQGIHMEEHLVSSIPPVPNTHLKTKTVKVTKQNHQESKKELHNKASQLHSQSTKLLEKTEYENLPEGTQKSYDIETIKTALEKEKEELKNFHAILAENQEQYHELEKAWEEQKTAEFSKRVTNFIDAFAMEMYKNQKNREENHKRKRDLSNIEHQHAAEVDHYRSTKPHENLSLPYFQRNVYQSVTPNYISYKNRLDDVKNFAREYQEMQENLHSMVENRKHLIDETNKIEDTLDEYDRNLQNAYNNSLRKKRKLIQKLHHINTGIMLTSSLLLGPAPIVGAALKVGSMGTEILANHYSDKESNERNELEQRYKQSSELHFRVGAIKNSALQNIEQIEQVGMNSRQMLVTAIKSGAVVPSEGRMLLQEGINNLKNETNLIHHQIQNNQASKALMDEAKIAADQKIIQSFSSNNLFYRGMVQLHMPTISANWAILSLEMEKTIMSQTENLEEKQKLLDRYQNTLKDKLLTAAIEDYLFDQLQQQLPHQSDNVEIANWRDAIQARMGEINYLRNGRMQAVNNNFIAVEQIFAELSRLCDGHTSHYMNNIQTTVSIIGRGYNMYELYKSFRQGLEIFHKTFDSLPSGGSIVDTIIKMGPETVLINFVLPGFQFIHLGVSALRLGKHLVSSKQQELTIGHLSKFLENLSNHFNKQIKFLGQGIFTQHLEIKRMLENAMSTTEKLCEEINREICLTRQLILKEIQHTDYTNKTLEIQKRGQKMVNTCNKYLSTIQNRKEKEEKFFDKLLTRMEIWLHTDTVTSQYNGLMPKRMATGNYSLTKFVPLEEVKYNPEIYSGLIGLKVLNSENIPSLYLLNSCIECYMAMNRCNEKLSEEQIHRMNAFKIHLKAQIDQIIELSDRFIDYAMKVHKEQQRFIKQCHEQIKYVDTLQTQLQKSLLTEYRNIKTLDLSLLSGKSKFQLAFALIRKKIITNLTYSFWKAQKQTDFEELLEYHSIISLRRFLGSKEINSSGNFQDKVTEVWITSKGEIQAAFYQQNAWTTTAKIGSISKSPNYLYHGQFLTGSNAALTTCADSQISEIEIKNIIDHFPPCFQYDRYQKQIEELLNSYTMWLSNEKSEIVNPFGSLANPSVLLCSKTPSLVPLLFPKELIKACENLFCVEKTLLALFQMIPIIPSYSFEYSEDKESYILKLHFDCSINYQYASLIEFEIAQFDKITVNSFKKSSFENSSEANLNEFLIQCMYTHVLHSPNVCLLGLPGSTTIEIKEENWIPVERSFPGLHKLFTKNPKEKFYFDSKKFTEKARDSLINFAETGQMSTEIDSFFVTRPNPKLLPGALQLFESIRKLPDDFNNEVKPLIESHQILIAYCCLISSLDQTTMHSQLASWLGIATIQTEMDILEKIALCSLPEIPDESSIEKFKNLLVDNQNPQLKFLKDFNLNCFLTTKD